MTGNPRSKDHFVIIDCVGVVEHPKIETRPLERQPSVPFKRLIEWVAMGATDDDTLSSLASRLARLQKQLDPADEADIQAVGLASSLNLAGLDQLMVLLLAGVVAGLGFLFGAEVDRQNKEKLNKKKPDNKVKYENGEKR